jgi:tetratricopeptide (TPR) repeat protein
MKRCICLAIVLAAAGCSHELTPQGQQLLASAYASYQAGDDAATVQAASAFIRDHSKEPRLDEALLLSGMARYRLKDYDNARRDLQQASRLAASPSVQATAEYDLGCLAYDTGDMQLTADAMRRAITFAGDGGGQMQLLAGAHLRLGEALQHLGQWQEADEHFYLAETLQPGSDIAQRAAQRVNCRAWSVQVAICAQADQARELVRELRASQLPADYRPGRSEKPSYIVHVGRLERYDQAQQMLQQVRQSRPEASIITID